MGVGLWWARVKSLFDSPNVDFDAILLKSLLKSDGSQDSDITLQTFQSARPTSISISASLCYKSRAFVSRQLAKFVNLYVSCQKQNSSQTTTKRDEKVVIIARLFFSFKIRTFFVVFSSSFLWVKSVQHVKQEVAAVWSSPRWDASSHANSTHLLSLDSNFSLLLVNILVLLSGLLLLQMLRKSVLGKHTQRVSHKCQCHALERRRDLCSVCVVSCVYTTSSRLGRMTISTMCGIS